MDGTKVVVVIINNKFMMGPRTSFVQINILLTDFLTRDKL